MYENQTVGKSFMKRMQLICVGYAGSVAANFNILASHMGEDISVSVVEYSGRGSRSREAPYADNDELVADVAEQIRIIRNWELPYAILGYSMGAQVVYELFAWELLPEMPVCTFLAAHEPPDVDCFGKSINMDDDAAFLEHVKKYGGLDERLLQDARFASIFVSRMKQDFRLLKDYRFNGSYHEISSDVVMLYCENDTPYEVIKGWQRFSKKEIRFHQMGQSHFFFKTDTEEFCEVLLAEMRKCM